MKTTPTFHAIRLLVLFAGLLLPLSSLHAETCLASLQASVQRVQSNQPDPQKTADENGLKGKLTFEENTPCLVGAILSNLGYPQNTVARIKAAFQQNGASVGSGGSTNVVSKGITANILSVASEYGALTETTSGQTVTLQGTLAGIPTFLESGNLLKPCTNTILAVHCIKDSTFNNLSRFSYTVAFAASQNSPQVSGSSSGSNSSSQPLTFNASYHSINSASAKVVLIQGASASPLEISKAITALTDNTTLSTNGVTTAQTALITDFGTALQTWANREFSKLSTANAQEVEDEWKSWGAALEQSLCANNPNCKLQQDAADYADAYTTYQQAQHKFFSNLRHAPVLSLEYDANLPVSQPSNSTIRLIGAISPTPSLTFTLNAASSFYNGTPSASIPGAQILRDFQVAAETAYTLGSKTTNILGASTASLAYYYQDQTSPAILNVAPGQPVPGVTFTNLPANATQVFAQRGVINLAQAKFNFNPRKSSINIPFSVTWSNRTELVTQPAWRGQVGITYDFDSLFSALGK